MDHHFDINCDLGESSKGSDLVLEKSMMPMISSCNIACGFHAGDPFQMSQIIDLALINDVKIGAHPSYPDKENFGRIKMDINYDHLLSILLYQIGGLLSIAQKKGTQLHHVKAHGALYNEAAKSEMESQAIVNAILAINPNLVLYCLPSSITSQIARHYGIAVCHEAFIDRTYHKDGSLTARSMNDAVIHDTDQAANQFLQVALHNTITSVEGDIIPMHAQTFCIHGDNPNAFLILKKCHSLANDSKIKIG